MRKPLDTSALATMASRNMSSTVSWGGGDRAARADLGQRVPPQHPEPPIPAATSPWGGRDGRVPTPHANRRGGIWCPHSHPYPHALLSGSQWAHGLTRGTSSPFSMMACSFLPRSEPELTSARSRSPVERWV